MSENPTAKPSSTPEDGDDTTDPEKMRLELEEELAPGEVPSRWVDLGISVAVLILFLGLLAYSWGAEGITLGRSSDPGAMFWPRLIMGAILITAVLSIVQISRQLKEQDKAIIPEKSVIVEGFNMRFRDLSDTEKEFYLVIGLTILYLLALKPVGYLLTSPIYLFAFGWILGYYKPIKLAATSILVSAAIFIGFRIYMNIALPYGDGPMRAFHLFVESLF